MLLSCCQGDVVGKLSLNKSIVVDHLLGWVPIRSEGWDCGFVQRKGETVEKGLKVGREVELLTDLGF